MNFALTEDQELLKDSVERYLDKEYDFARRDRILKSGSYSPEQWRAFADLGWLAAPFPEAMGGLGGGGVETHIIMQALGRRLVLEPFAWTAVIGGRLLLDGAADARREELVGQVIAGELQLAVAGFEGSHGHRHAPVATAARPGGAGWRIDGRKTVVPNGAIADRFIVAARTSGEANDLDGVSLFLVARDAPGVGLRAYRTNDGQTAAELALEDVAVGEDDLLGRIGHGAALLTRALDVGAAALCAEAVGSMTYLVEATSDYLKQREQYGKPLAQFQVLQHRLADMYVSVELARSMAYVAAAAVDQPDDTLRMRDVSAAKLQVDRSARFVGQQAVQLHGGMGMSEELDIAHHFKRLSMIALLCGDETYHLRRFADLSDQADTAAA